MRATPILLAVALAAALLFARSRNGRSDNFVATAHSQEGRTASGTMSRTGTVAADPKVLPLGSRIRIHNAGPYSGDYTVTDTGALVKGRWIDIYMRSNREAKKFGRKHVKVQILERGKPD